jgi:hypothetical protein
MGTAVATEPRRAADETRTVVKAEREKSILIERDKGER